MDIKKQYEIKLEELQITKIPADQITKDSRSYLYNEMVVETISFNTSKIINQIRFFNYLKYMKDVKNQYTIKNILLKLKWNFKNFLEDKILLFKLYLGGECGKCRSADGHFRPNSRSERIFGQLHGEEGGRTTHRTPDN